MGEKIMNLIMNRQLDQLIGKEVIENPLMIAYKEAHQQYLQTMINFDNAENNYIEVAIHEFNAARKKIEIIIKEMRKEGLSNESTINLQ